MTVKGIRVKKERPNKKLDLSRSQQNNPELIAKALLASKGRIATAAELMGVTSGTLKKKIKLNSSLRDLLDHIALKRINNAEDGLDDLIEARDFKAIKYLLDRKGKEEGYGEESTVNHNIQQFGVLMIEAPSQTPEEWSKKSIQERQEQNLAEKTIELIKNMDGKHE